MERTVFEIRKTQGGYSIDKKEGKIWIFITKVSSKKKAKLFISEFKIKTKQLSLNF